MGDEFSWGAFLYVVITVFAGTGGAIFGAAIGGKYAVKAAATSGETQRAIAEGAALRTWRMELTEPLMKAAEMYLDDATYRFQKLVGGVTWGSKMRTVSQARQMLTESVAVTPRLHEAFQALVGSIGGLDGVRDKDAAHAAYRGIVVAYRELQRAREDYVFGRD